MEGLALIVKDSELEGPRVRTQMPVMRGLQSVSFFGQSLELSRANLARRAATPAALLGAPPTVSPYKITVDESNGLAFPESGETANFTLIVAARAVDTSQSANSTRFPGIGWHQGGSTNRGAQLYSGGSTVMRFRADFTTGGVPTSIQGSLANAAGAQNVARIWAFVVEDGVGMWLYDLTAGTAPAFVANTTARVPYTSVPLKMGPYLGGDGGFGDYYGKAHHNVTLIKSEIDAQAAVFARRAKKRDGTILIPGF